MLQTATPDWTRRAVSAADVVAHVKSGMNLFLHGACATPSGLLDALSARKDLENVRIYHLHTASCGSFVAPDQAGKLLSISLFVGPPARAAVNEGRADFVPVFLSDIPGLITSGRIRIDALLMQLSPPDRHGYCTLGTSVDAARAAADVAPLLLAEINDRMPRTHGNTSVPVDKLTAFDHIDRPIFEAPPAPQSAVESRIGEIVAELIEDRSCLQLGIGAIPDAVLARLGNKRDLGIHTEMFSDGLVDLVATGAVTNRYKAVHPGRIVTSFVMGTRKLFDFIDDNPLVEFHGCDRTNDTALIRKNDRVVAINSALQIDLTGQVCADSIGHRIYSGIGGQMDFIRGAALSRGGKPILALPATANDGKLSRITHELLPGAGVVTTRGHVHWVVTEYGAVNLHGRTLRERGEALIAISHPDFRPELKKQLHAIRHFPMS
ncbi:MAG: acetyl-CoA hydrolase/transferase family protein [Planctomycetes bacterium]|nr:acetyl-CoA hydrolase/transferase family protein [Planctomycetota bacterium]